MKFIWSPPQEGPSKRIVLTQEVFAETGYMRVHGNSVSSVDIRNGIKEIMLMDRTK